MARRQNEERARLLETFLGSRLNTGHEDGVILLDRLGRVILCAGGRPIAAQVGGVERDIHLGLRLLDLSERMSDADVAAALPEGLRPRDVSKLRIGGELSGAALVFRRDRAAPRLSDVTSRLGEGGQSLIVGRSPALLEAVELARQFARRGTSVLIEGETGVGKELLPACCTPSPAGGRMRPSCR